VMMLASPLYSQASSNISTPMAAKMEKISSECSIKVTGLRSGFSTTLEPIQALHIVLHGALSAVKKSLSLNIQMALMPPSTLELLKTIITPLRIRLATLTMTARSLQMRSLHNLLIFMWQLMRQSTQLCI
jgi:hypothetical protein